MRESEQRFGGPGEPSVAQRREEMHGEVGVCGGLMGET